MIIRKQISTCCFGKARLTVHRKHQASHFRVLRFLLLINVSKIRGLSLYSLQTCFLRDQMINGKNVLGYCMHFFTDSNSASNFSFFIPILHFLQKKRFGVLLALFAYFEIKFGWNGSKRRKNVFCTLVLELNVAPINGLGEPSW